MGRKYDLVIFDMDGTLTSVRSSWGFIHDEMGVDNEAAYQAFVNMEIDEEEFTKRDIALWMEAKPGIKAVDIARMMVNLPLIPGIQETVAALHYNGIKCAICSGGLDIAAKMIADEFGFDYYTADELEVDGEGRLTGNGILHVRLSDKGNSAKKIMKMFGAKPERTISVGNSFTDVPMFKETKGMSIAFNPVDMDYTGAAADHIVKSNNISDILDFIFEVEDGI